MEERGIPWEEYLDGIRLDQPRHEWLREIAEVSGAGEPKPRPRSCEGGLGFPGTEPGPYAHLRRSELFIMAAWHLHRLYGLRGEMEAGEFSNSDARHLKWHEAALCAIHAALGDEFELWLGGLAERLSRQTDEWVSSAVVEREKLIAN